MANDSSPRKRSGSLLLIGQCLHLCLNLFMLTFVAGMLLMLFATVSVFYSGWRTTWEIFEAALLGMTSSFWAAHTNNPFLISLLLVTQFIVERCRIFASGCIFLSAFSALGFVDGLVRRDIRKFQNARESTFLFHRSKNLLFALFYTGYFLFIVIPLNMPLTLLLTLMALGICILSQLATKQFKKHL